jgi:hypothetical protein
VGKIDDHNHDAQEEWKREEVGELGAVTASCATFTYSLAVQPQSVSALQPQCVVISMSSLGGRDL